jgi:hypothetical protein
MTKWNVFFYKFPKYHTDILLLYFKAKISTENIAKPTIGNESLHEDSNDNGVRVVNFATSKSLRVKSTMFPHRNIYKHFYLWVLHPVAHLSNWFLVIPLIATKFQYVTPPASS